MPCADCQSAERRASEVMREAAAKLIPQEAVDIITDLVGARKAQSGTTCRVVEDHLRQLIRRALPLPAPNLQETVAGSPKPVSADEARAAGCDLCVGACRGHSFGRPDEWNPEPGSRAYAALIQQEAGHGR